MEDGSTLAMGRDVEGCSGNEKVDDGDRVGEHGSDALEGEEIGEAQSAEMTERSNTLHLLVLMPVNFVIVMDSTVEGLSFSTQSASVQDALSCALAKRTVGLVKSGMVIGLGTRCILSLVIGELGKLIKEGKVRID
ncbi:hypothetical protein TIFTF001_041576 [Ficus carica]|uniref:Uncharacterized protein n=1 Tax=Ficus carica TaxID=3494 RepID=A0AA88CVH3_FICCA|nr:hypothetical protein TIFTF001_041576 [Ficus carica]